MKIVIDNAIPFIQGRFPENLKTLYIPGDKICRENIKDADALIIRTRTKCDEMLLKDTNVKFIATATIGTDHIDKNWCEANGIKVASAPGCNAPGVAQYVLSSLLHNGFDTKSQTLGIIGYGNVGSVVAKWAEVMGIKTQISDAPRKKLGYSDVDYKPLDEVLANSDAVTLHVPLTHDTGFPTFHMIGKRELSLMKKGGFIINSSRGGVVDEKELIEKIKDGSLRAILDVWENEPDINPELAKLCTVATPHIAGYSKEGKSRATKMVLEALGSQFKIPVDLSGLDCVENGQKISKKLILDSYDPMYDHRSLMENLNNFEKLRNGYEYRHEPLFI